MEQFERLFFDNINGDFTEVVEDYNYNNVNFLNKWKTPLLVAELKSE